MEQQVSPLGKPMSTAIKRSTQVNEMCFCRIYRETRIRFSIWMLSKAASHFV